jgi:hypothetical protein
MIAARSSLVMLAAVFACGPLKVDETGDETEGGSSSSVGHSSSSTTGDDPPNPSTPTGAPGSSSSSGSSEPPDPSVPVTTDPTIGGTSTTMPPETTSEASETSLFETTHPTQPSGPDDTAGTFIVVIDLPEGACSTWEENCAEGQKCMPFSEGGSGWDDLKCVPLAPDPQAPGEPCEVEGDSNSGIDDCAMHSMCFSVDDDNEGVCVPMCTGTPDAPVCPDGTACLLTDVLSLCLPTCDPLLQNCAAGDQCAPLGLDFLCVPDASGGQGAVFDACEFVNGCDPGLACLTPEAAPQCEGDLGCCMPFCDLEAPPDCPPATECVPWFEEGQAPAGLASVGVCFGG